MSRSSEQPSGKPDEEKKRLFRRMIEGGYNAEQIRILYQEVDYLMSLPIDLEREVEEVLEEIKRRRRRKWIAPQERLVVERGLRQGLEEGLQQGVREGIVRTLKTVLRARFGEVSEEALEVLNSIEDAEVLSQLSVEAVQSPSLEAFLETVRTFLVDQVQTQ